MEHKGDEKTARLDWRFFRTGRNLWNFRMGDKPLRTMRLSFRLLCIPTRNMKSNPWKNPIQRASHMIAAALCVSAFCVHLSAEDLSGEVKKAVRRARLTRREPSPSI
jgi:hypothetical protein